MERWQFLTNPKPLPDDVPVAMARTVLGLLAREPDQRPVRPEFRAALDATPGGITLLAIDEAHCITKWGHDFRPAYQRVGEFRERVGAPPTDAAVLGTVWAFAEDDRLLAVRAERIETRATEKTWYWRTMWHSASCSRN